MLGKNPNTKISLFTKCYAPEQTNSIITSFHFYVKRIKGGILPVDLNLIEESTIKNDGAALSQKLLHLKI